MFQLRSQILLLPSLSSNTLSHNNTIYFSALFIIYNCHGLHFYYMSSLLEYELHEGRDLACSTLIPHQYSQCSIELLNE